MGNLGKLVEEAFFFMIQPLLLVACYTARIKVLTRELANQKDDRFL